MQIDEVDKSESMKSERDAVVCDWERLDAPSRVRIHVFSIAGPTRDDDAEARREAVRRAWREAELQGR